MVLFGVDELNPDYIEYYQQLCKRNMLNVAMTEKGGKETDWIFRQWIVGGPTGSYGVGWVDSERKTLQGSANGQHWGQVASDLTAETLSETMKVATKIPSNKYVGIYGCGDLSPEGSELTGSATLYPATGALNQIEFNSDAVRLGLWDAQHLYSFPNVCGITDNPIMFKQENEASIKMCFSEATEDKFVYLLGYICEKQSDAKIKPSSNTMDIVGQKNEYGKFYGDGRFEKGHISGGLDPIAFLSPEEIQRRFDIAKWKITQMAIEDKVVKSMDEMNFREAIYADGSAVTGSYDINQKTQYAAGSREYVQDAADMTAVYVLYEQTDTSFEIANKTYLAVVGFFDRTPNPDLTNMMFRSGSGAVENWQVEHCYTGPICGGLTDRPIIFREQEELAWLCAFKSATVDRFVGLRTVIASPPGKFVAK